MTDDLVERVADALVEAFKERITGYCPEVQFGPQGVTIPRRDIWLHYAKAAVSVTRPDGGRG